MFRRAGVLVVVVSILVPSVAAAAEDPLRVVAERIGGSVYPAESEQPVTQLMFSNSAVTDEAAQARAAAILGGWGSAADAALPALRRLAESDSSASFDAKFAIDEIEDGEEN